MTGVTPSSKGSRVHDRSDRRLDVWRGTSSYYNSECYYGGYSSWHGSYIGLSFSFGCAPSWCSWGLYSYPYYYCSYWPRWYSCYRYGFGFYWNSCYPWYADPGYGYGYGCWWPGGYYRPSVYVSYSYYDDDFDEGAYYATSYDGGSVTVHEDETTDPAGERITVGGRPTRVDPASLAEHHVSLGDFYFKEERFQEAAESYLRALSYATDDATIHFVLADALFAVGDYHYAAFMIGKALRLDPSLASSDADKRTFYTNAATFEKQLKTLKDYVADKPYDAAAQVVLGYNLNFSGQREEAEKVFRHVLEIEPSNEIATAFVQVYEAAQAGAGAAEKKE